MASEQGQALQRRRLWGRRQWRGVVVFQGVDDFTGAKGEDGGRGWGEWTVDSRVGRASGEGGEGTHSGEVRGPDSLEWSSTRPGSAWEAPVFSLQSTAEAVREPREILRRPETLRLDTDETALTHSLTQGRPSDARRRRGLG
jgi:hypothetical protein